MLIILFLVSHFNFLFIPCGRPSWLPISFYCTLNTCTHYRIVKLQYINKMVRTLGYQIHSCSHQAMFPVYVAYETLMHICCSYVVERHRSCNKALRVVIVTTQSLLKHNLNKLLQRHLQKVITTRTIA